MAARPCTSSASLYWTSLPCGLGRSGGEQAARLAVGRARRGVHLQEHQRIKAEVAGVAVGAVHHVVDLLEADRLGGSDEQQQEEELVVGGALVGKAV